jgi:hypothetical protein
MGGMSSKQLRWFHPIESYITKKTPFDDEAIITPLEDQAKKNEEALADMKNQLNTETSKDDFVTKMSAREAARIETARLKKKKGFRSTILTSPLGDTNTPPLKKAAIL